jgi:ABC-2 type transport system ATP-binding protein
MTALVHRPDILYLDEPTIGLDVVAKARVRGFLQEINRTRGTTILITSHDMDDIEALCNRVIIIDHGRIQYDGALQQLVHEIQPRKQVRATYADPVIDLSALDPLGIAPDERSVDEDSRIIRLEVPRERINDVLAVLPGLGSLVDLEIADAEVDEIIRELFTHGREVRI